jgi:uncharacterized protein (DUF58 family)
MWLSKHWLQIGLTMLFLGAVFSNGPLMGIAVFLLAAGTLAKLWSANVFKRLRYERIIPENRAFAGESLSLTLRLANDKLLPVPWIEMKDAIPDGVLQEEDQATPAPYPNYVILGRSTHLSWYERISWPLKFQGLKRGYYRLGPVHLTSGDIFGFNPVEREDKTFDSIIVYPRVYTLPELGLPSERPFGELRGRDRIFEDPSRSAGLRDYRPGDPMRRIDWKASARRQALQSRVYEPSSTMHLLVAVNVHTLDHTWEGFIPYLLERLLSTAASVASYGFEAGYAVGLIANGAYPDSDRPMRIPVGRRSDQLMRILEALAVIGPMTLFPLEVTLEREAQSFPFGATLVCVTARMNPELAAALLRVAATGHTVTVLSLATRDFAEDLGNIRVYKIADTMRELEAAAGIVEPDEVVI